MELLAVANCFSCVWPFATLWPVACQALLSMGFSWQEYWSGLPWSSLGDLPDPRIKPRCPALQADSLPSNPDVELLDQMVILCLVVKGTSVLFCRVSLRLCTVMLSVQEYQGHSRWSLLLMGAPKTLGQLELALWPDGPLWSLSRLQDTAQQQPSGSFEKNEDYYSQVLRAT